ncbi:MAG: 4'-phosphopantetheinyl transferase superfamily protein, partial [Spirochaetia bacterium]|nr:4'-phosphopantetheinyl transferase superfamily protein [Spirochaetia bacterium]
FTAGEERLLKENQFSKPMLWSLWACKEAAFKAISAEFPGTPFRWKNFEIQRDFKTIHFASHEFSIRINQNEEYVHAAVCGKIECGRIVQNRFCTITSKIGRIDQIEEKFEKMNKPKIEIRKNEIFSEEFLSKNTVITLNEILRSEIDESAAVRILGIEAISEKYAIGLNDIFVTGVSSGRSVPPFFYNSKGENISRASFSHHGNFVSVTIP